MYKNLKIFDGIFIHVSHLRSRGEATINESSSEAAAPAIGIDAKPAFIKA